MEGALDLFKQSYNLRDFERKLNTQRNWVNNLDLNYDGRTDYIRVEHQRQGDFHAIVLQALLDRRDVQDVAVIEIEVLGRREAILQIIGDEDLYGEEVIVEPREGYSDSRRGYRSDYGDFVNVYYWEPIQYILGRQYRVYASPYRWQYYPTWWNPWRPCTWDIFRPRIVVYHRYYNVVHIHRVIRVHNFYRPRRAYSITIVQRANRVRIRQGRAPIYREAPSRQNRISTDRRGNDVVERPRTSTRSNTSGQNPAVSRKKTQSAAGRSATRSSIPRTDQKSRGSVTRSGTPRTTTPNREPSIRSRNSTPSFDRGATRSSSPKADQRSRGSINNPRTSRASTSTQKPSVRSRSTNSSFNQKTTRSSAPKVRQPSRSTTSPRSKTTTRSTTPTRKPSVSSRTVPASKPRVSRSTPSRVQQPSHSKRTRSSAPSRSRTSTRSTMPNRKPPSSSIKRSTSTSKPRATRSSTSKRSSSSGSSAESEGRRLLVKHWFCHGAWQNQLSKTKLSIHFCCRKNTRIGTRSIGIGIQLIGRIRQSSYVKRGTCIV